MTIKLTKRQKQISDKILLGYTNTEICKDLKLAVQTVKYHVTLLYKKTGVKNRSQFIVKMLSEASSGPLT